jgi:hypothetical protein
MARRAEETSDAVIHREFNDLVDRVQIRDVQLMGARVEADASFIAAHGAVADGAEVSLEIGGTGRVTAAPLRVECEMRMTWQAMVPGTEEILVQIHEQYLVTYDVHGSDPVGEDVLRAFTDNNAAFNVWPFFRQSLHATTLRMGIPAYTLPLLKPRT